MKTVPQIPPKPAKPIVRVSPRQFLENRDILMSPLIDCRVVFWLSDPEWEPPREPIHKPPSKPSGVKPKYKVLA